MPSYKRHAKKWTIPELLNLEKELDQNITIKKIAALHKRSERAILFKIFHEQTTTSPSKSEPEISQMFTCKMTL